MVEEKEIYQKVDIRQNAWQTKAENRRKLEKEGIIEKRTITENYAKEILE